MKFYGKVLHKSKLIIFAGDDYLFKNNCYASKRVRVMILICSNESHVSMDTVSALVETIKECNGNAYVASDYNRRLYDLRWFLYRAFRKFHIEIIPNVLKVFYGNPLEDKGHLLAIMMGFGDVEMKWRPYGIRSRHNKSLFLFDAWPDSYQSITYFCNTYRINYLFVTSKQSANRLTEALPNVRVGYIPEGINFEEFRQIDYDERTIDVLALGRKWDKYHNMIVEDLATMGLSYYYERVKGEIIFPDRESFIEGLSKTKISICVPSSITHPERSGDVETMTVRYLESMASKCLILGIAPKEMIDLFGYNPIVEIDLHNPVNQIKQILQNYKMYFPLIEKNFQEVRNNQTWKNRYEQMKDIWSNSIL